MSQAVDPTVSARLYGEPLLKLPTDLYIPPDALQVFLEAFEGPLDLLLYLIRKQNFNILDIPMLQVTQQYLRYVDEIRNRNLELASEYLLMAALLLEIKSRMLLPTRKKEGEPEAHDPRAELVRRLLEYERIKQFAALLDGQPQQGRDFVSTQVHIEQSLEPHFPEVNAADLQIAWLDVLRRASLVQHHHITAETLSVREYMSRILKQLQGRHFITFESIFAPEAGRTVLVVTLIALLELAKETLIEITQAEAYAPIYLRLAYTPIEDSVSLMVDHLADDAVVM